MTAAVRPLRMVQQTYSIHRLYDDGRSPVWTAPGETLDDCLAAVLPLTSQGDKFAIFERDHMHGEVVMRTYVVKLRKTGHVIYVGTRLQNAYAPVAELRDTVRFPGGVLPL